MTQQAYFDVNGLPVTVELPEPDAEVLPGVFWGRMEYFPTPAYWVFQTLAKRFEGRSLQYKLGHTFLEEVGACLLGGHGIPANVGLAAYDHLHKKGAFDGSQHGAAQLYQWLSEPIAVGDRHIKYRFARQKSEYLAAAISRVTQGEWQQLSGKSLRDWLLAIPGVGLKTASWIVRNWQDADDVAIIDIHLFRAGVIAKLFEPDWDVQRHYLTMEERYLQFSRALHMKPSELDAVIWYEMARSQECVMNLMKEANLLPKSQNRSGSASDKASTNTRQTALAI